MRLLIKQGAEQRILLQSGKNIIDKVKLTVQDSLLTARYDDGCNLARDYGVTQLTITSPHIRRIRNASIYDVVSEGLLTYPNLSLESTTLSEDSGDFYNSGGFSLNVDANGISILANGKALFKLTGKTNNLTVNFADKTARLEGGDLMAQHVEVFHRSANAMIVNPQQSLQGIITGTGDLISVNRPPEVSMDERFTGKLIFKTN